MPDPDEIVAQLKANGDAAGLIGLLEDINSSWSSIYWGRRDAIVRALGEIGDSRAIDPLVARLMDHHHESRRIVGDALIESHWQPHDEAERACLLVAMEQWQEAADVGIAALGPLLNAHVGVNEYAERNPCCVNPPFSREFVTALERVVQGAAPAIGLADLRRLATLCDVEAICDYQSYGGNTSTQHLEWFDLEGVRAAAKQELRRRGEPGHPVWRPARRGWRFWAR